MSKKKRAKRNEYKVHNNSVPAPQKIPAMIIWDGVKLSVKKQTHAAVKDRVCTDSAFIYIYIYKTLLRHLKKETKQR